MRKDRGSCSIGHACVLSNITAVSIHLLSTVWSALWRAHERYQPCYNATLNCRKTQHPTCAVVLVLRLLPMDVHGCMSRSFKKRCTAPDYGANHSELPGSLLECQPPTKTSATLCIFCQKTRKVTHLQVMSCNVRFARNQDHLCALSRPYRLRKFDAN